MKLKLLRWLLPAIVPAALMFGAASPAHAVSYNCDGPINPVPANPSGSVEIEVNSGDCIIDHDIEAQGSIVINVYNGKINTEKLTSVNGHIFLNSFLEKVKTKKLSAGTVIKVQAGLLDGSTASSIDIGDVWTNTLNTQVATENGNVLLQAWGPISTRDIKTNNDNFSVSKRSGAVQIDAYMGGSSTLFTIGAASNNGINGVIDTRSLDGGGFATGRVESGIRITNGTANSTGGITVVAMTKIKVRNSNSRAGQIELNAQKGTLTLPSGDLDVTEQNAKGAGFIFLLANKIVTADGTKLKASQASTSPGTIHQVVIAAETIQFQGLTITADGSGVNPVQMASVYVIPEGGINSVTFGDVNNLLWQRFFVDGFFYHPGLVSFEGAGSAPLTITADGDNTQIGITGSVVRFTGGPLTIRARGNINHQVVMGFFGDAVGGDGLRFENSDTVTITANAKDNSNGGYVQIQTKDRISMLAPRHFIRANGPADGNGNGGQVIFISPSTVLSGKADISADAASNGTGNAIVNELFSNGPHAILFQPGSDDLNFGTGDGHFHFSAKGGELGGNGGSVIIASQQAKFVLRNKLVIDASAPSDSGNGGKVLLSGQSVKFSQGDSGNATEIAVKAKAGTDNGLGGVIVLNNPVKPTGVTTGFGVLSHMVVDGGSNIASNAFDGSITINDVLCQQWKYGSGGSFPTSYWNCVNPTSPTSLDQIPATVADGIPNGTTKSALADGKVAIFIHASPQKNNLFFLDSSPLIAVGFTFQELTRTGDPIHVSVFASCTDCNGHSGSAPLTDLQLREATAHELGHAFDYVHIPLESSGFYNNYRLNDLIQLDFVALGTDRTTSTPRLPCRPTPGYTDPPPFVDVKFYNTLTSAPIEFCDGMGNLVFPVPAGTLNSTILGDFSANHANVSSELFSQSFAFVRSSNPLDYLDPSVDGVLAKNFFYGCALGRANQISNGSGTIPSYCLNSVPTWYLPLVP